MFTAHLVRVTVLHVRVCVVWVGGGVRPLPSHCGMTHKS
jgi:hypothetical protein